MHVFIEKPLSHHLSDVAAFMALLVGVTRVYLGVHYPTDVAAGWTAGVAWAVGCWGVARWLRKRKGAMAPGANGDSDEGGS